MLVRNQGYSYWYTATQIQGCADGVNTAPVANQMDMQDAHPGQASRFTVPDYAFFDIESQHSLSSVSYTHLRAHETVLDLVCRLLLEKKKNTANNTKYYIIDTISN